MTPSPQQTTVLDFIDNGIGHVSVRASAGAAKTTTLVWIAQRVPRPKRVLAVAFGRDAADSLRARVPIHVIADTHHKFGLSMLKSKFGRVRPEDKKLTFLLAEIVPDKRERFRVRDAVFKLVGFAKNNAFGVGGPFADLSDVADFYNIEVTGHHIDVAQRLLDASAARLDIVDFDDMLWLPLRHNLCYDGGDFVLLDEAQDTNPSQALLLDKMLAPNGRLVIVGDPNQAIYAFRGASHGAMEKLEAKYSMTVLPLSVSFRCSKSVVAEAQRVLAKPLIPKKPKRVEGPTNQDGTPDMMFDDLEHEWAERERHPDTLL